MESNGVQRAIWGNVGVEVLVGVGELVGGVEVWVGVGSSGMLSAIGSVNTSTLTSTRGA